MASGGQTLFAQTPGDSNDDLLLYRLQILICDGGLMVLRNIIDQTLTAQDITLSAFLKRERSNIDNLKRHGVITQTQYNILFPDYDQVPATEDMDITLVICLCELIQNFDRNTTSGHDVPVVSAIRRLRTLRNKICDMSISRIPHIDFTTLWRDIEEVLVKRSSPALNIQHIIDDFKTFPLDPKESKRIQKEIKKWKDCEANVGRLEDEMKEISADVSDVSKNLEEIKIPQHQRTPQEPFELFVKGSFGKTFSVSVESDISVVDLKVLIQDKNGIPTDQQILTFAGKRLLDEHTIQDYNITKTSTEYLVLKSRGDDIVGKSDEKAIEQLSKGDKPSQASVNLACRQFGRKHKVVKDMCTKVCTYIQKTQPDVIKSVWPSYRYVKDAPVEQFSENDVIFVVVTQPGKKENIEKTKFKTYKTYIRESSEISRESKEVNTLEAKITNYEDKGIRRKQKRIRKCMNGNVDKLLEKHSNITSISASLFKSRKFKLGEQNFERNLCIVLFVHVKGYIPLHEDRFDQKIDEYDVDVRECVFTPLVTGPKDFHSILKMGLEIGITSNPNAPGNDSQIGTIGHFEPEYFVTCAHVVMTTAEMCRLSNNQKFGKQTDINIYQPLEQDSRKICGRVIRAVYYQKSGKNNVGVDAALVEIKDREFTGCEFPHSDLLINLGLTGNLSQILQPGIYWPNHDKYTEVIKYGCESNVTKGRYTFISNPVVTLEARGIRLRNQITIVPTEDFPQFAVGGDSGAVVFEFIDGKLYPTCMVEGAMEDGRIVATPLIDVLVALNIKSPEDVIKLYEDEDDESDMDDGS